MAACNTRCPVLAVCNWKMVWVWLSNAGVRVYLRRSSRPQFEQADCEGNCRIDSFNWGSSTMRNFIAITPHHEYKTLLDAQRGKERLR